MFLDDKMKKIFMLFMLNIMVMMAWASHPAKMNLWLNHLSDEAKRQEATRAKGTTPEKVGVLTLVRMAKGGSENAITDHGGFVVKQLTGDLVIALLPVDKLDAIAIEPSVRRLSANPLAKALMDSVRYKINADKAYIPSAATQQTAFTGKGVVTGVCDSGFDFTHPMFQDEFGNPRIKSFYDQIEQSSTANYYGIGRIYDSSEEIFELGGSSDKKSQIHGSHVLGIMAGSPLTGQKHKDYTGIAYESDIVPVCIDFASRNAHNINYTGFDAFSSIAPSDVEYLLANLYVMDYAEAHNQPCVVNNSWGGPMSFDTNVEDYNDAYASIQGPGRVVVFAAGNSGDQYLYHKWKANTPDTLAFTLSKDANLGFITFRSKQPFTLTRLVDTYREVDGKLKSMTDTVRYDFSKVNAAQDTAYYTEKTTFIYNRRNKDRYSFYAEIIKRGNEYIMALVDDRETGAIGTSHYIALEGDDDIEALGSIDCITFDPQDDSDSNYDELREEGGYPYSICSPGCYNSVISVGAINTRTWFENIDDRCMSYDGNIEETGKVVYWSSRGPNLSGEIVPTVVAPGHNILSALNHYAENQYKQSMFTDTLLTTSSASDQHYKMAAMSGTSMSTPVVSGVIALWLQANPTLTTAQVKEVMAKTSHHTADEDVWPNNDYGYGVIDAYAGLLEVLQLPSKIQDISTSQPAQTKIAISDKTLTISTIEGAGPLRVRIYSTNGVLVGEFMTDRVQSSFDLVHLPSGIYAVQVTGNKKSVTGSTLIRL